LFGLPAQHLDKSARGQPRDGRYRLSRHGALGAEPPHGHDLAYGREGVTWIGQAPFTSEQHVFQNLGDGTYTHSGLLALRAAAAAGVNITYKILYNDAVAMTGGQPAEGGLTVSQIAHQVSAEGAKRLAIVSDEPEKYPANYFPAGATVHQRRDLDAVQKELRDVKGLSVLIYDQTCAAEKRRRRKRGLYPDPPKRVFINERVCEGCGHCSQASNCVSVQPLETELGRKRRIDQSNCNKDFSCIEGLCMAESCAKPTAPRPIRRLCSPICRCLRCRRWMARSTSWSPVSAAPASSPSARYSAWPPMSTARHARRSTSPACRRRTARS
jgi:indolepyruvate ferredoxin oxidoreductase